MGAPAVEPPNKSTWRSSALAGTTEYMMSAAVTRRGRAAGALCGAGVRKQRERRPRSATYGRSTGSRSSSRRGRSCASHITGGLGVQQRRSKRGKKLGNCLECLHSRGTVLGPAGKLAGGRRSASARLRLVGHLGWVHQHEACPVGEPRERM